MSTQHEEEAMKSPPQAQDSPIQEDQEMQNNTEDDPFAITDSYQISDTWTPLHAASETLNPPLLATLLATSRYLINSTTKEAHETALHKAIYSWETEFGDTTTNKVAIIKLLAEHGADLNPHDCVGTTPLHAAASNGYLEAAKALIECGAIVDPDRREPEEFGEADDGEGGCGSGNQHALAGLLGALTGGKSKRKKYREVSTPLHEAASGGHAEIVKLLLESGAKVDSFDIDDGTPLTCSVSNLAVCKILLDWPGGLACLNVKQQQGHLPIHYAGTGSPEVLKLLIDKGADVDIQIDQPDCWSHGGTALSAACGERHALENIEQNVRILLEAGADPNKQLGRKSTPFLLALNVGNAKAAKVILEKGVADLGSLATAEIPPLLVAATRDDAEICKLLIEHGCDVNITTTDGDEYTPIHNAAGYGNGETVKVLLAAGADIEAQNYDGRRALHMACFKGKIDCVRVLLAGGADIEAEDDSSWTPLHFAARYGHFEVVKLLVVSERGWSGAALNKKTTGGPGGGDLDSCTAADLARANGYDEIVEFLVEAGDTLSVADEIE